MSDTYELGPLLHNPARPFGLQDHNQNTRTLHDLIGSRGLLLGFIDDIWKPASIQRILFMQRHTHKFLKSGINLALVIHDKQHTLYSFHMSSPVPVKMELLADPDRRAHELYNIQHPALVYIDGNMMVRDKWLMPDERVWPKVQELLEAVQVA